MGEWRYKKLFIIATEGVRTEPLYFGIFQSMDAVVQVDCIKGKHDSSPAHVLKRMRHRLSTGGLRSSDEAWLVVDKQKIHGAVNQFFACCGLFAKPPLFQ
jgi:hypothetical protein